MKKLVTEVESTGAYLVESSRKRKERSLWEYGCGVVA